MHAIRTAVSALGCFDPDCDDDSMDAQRRKARLIAQIPIITAYFHRVRQGKKLVPPEPSLGEAANFLYLIDGEKPSLEKESTMDMCYVLHADHGMNASTFSARVTIATLSDMYSAITTAIGTLKGPLHGGANEGVIKMLQEIGSLDKVDAYIADALAQKKKIMGIGHRVYKTLDPRAPHLKRMAQILSAKLGEPKWIQMSERIAEIMLKEKAPQRQRRFLFRDRLLLARHSDRFVHAHFCHRAHRGLDGARARTTGGQPPDSPAERLHRPGRIEGGADRTKFSEQSTYEYQAKQLLAQYGVAVPPGEVCDTAEASQSHRRKTFCQRRKLVVVKSQIHAGGRGKGNFQERLSRRRETLQDRRRCL